MKKEMNTQLFVGIAQVVLLVFIVFQLNALNANLAGGVAPTAAPQAAPTPQPTPTAPTVAAPVDVSADDDAVKGDADAPVTIIEFSDYECPFCARFYDNTLAQIEEEYIKTGKVKFVYRDFPLPFHSNAKKAAEGAECAGEQGKYYDFHDLLFEDRDLSVTNLKKHAETIGLDTGKFNECLDSGAMASEVDKDIAEGRAAGVSGTPAFFVNGKLISGAQPFSAFKAAIDAELE